MQESKKVQLEIAVQDLSGARIACRAGADRIELCAGLGSTGGLTPSQALINLSSQTGLPDGVQVLIRPRTGGFVYDSDEKEVQVLDACLAIQAGASGIVVGALDELGRVDYDFAARMADVVHQESEREGRLVQLTFHRAFDAVHNREDALETLIKCGFQRVLTSGGASTVKAGLHELSLLVAQARGRIQVMAGGGLKPQDISLLVGVGVNAVHLSARKDILSPAGPGGGGEGSMRELTDEALVKAAADALQSTVD